MRDVKKYKAAGAALLALSMLAAACGSSSKSKSSTGTTEAVKEGGDLVFAAEQEPATMDWISSDAGAAWGVYTTEALTMPRAFDFTSDSEYKPGAMLAGEPKLETSPTQKVTYKINPKAVWDDGTPITSTDFKYTWDQIAHGKDIYDKSGYELISGVDDSDPKTAVVTFTKNYSPWRDLFGGFFGVFPSKLAADRNAKMKDGYTFSGGPWKLDHWTKGTEIKLIPNAAFWGQKPHLASITFKFEADTAAEQAAYQSGQVTMVYPQAQPGQDKLKGLPDTNFSAISGLSYEGLWFNTAAEPLTSLAVRKALAFATDRDAIVKQLFSPVQPDIKPINTFFTPAFGKFYSEPFAQYSPRNLDKVTELMTGDGWAKGADGIWAKAGKKADIELKTTTGTKRRQQTAEILASEWKEAGFNLTPNLEKASVLFGKDAPGGNFQVALYAQTPSSNDPSQCVIWCSKNIPTAANGNSGNNWTRLGTPEIDKPWIAVESELDDTKKADQAKEGGKLIAEGVPGLPLDPFPDIIVYNTAKIGGPVTHNFAFGPWVNANLWFAK